MGAAALRAGPAVNPAVNTDELRARVASRFWYHTIDLPGGVRTPGVSQTPPLQGDELPDLAGRSVIDIGAFDGYYSFAAERLGAARVVALDHYAWCVDFARRQAYWDECRALGRIPDSTRDLTEFWLPDAPGRAGFDLAREALASSVEPVVADFMSVDLAELGSFDVALFLGYLYHVKEPLGALERLRRITREVAVIETHAVVVEGYRNASLMLFHPGDELGGDFTNWYVPTEAALHGLCRAAGFSRVTSVRSHAFDDGEPVAPGGSIVPAFRDFRVTVHAFV
jgi:tRNA (mo5U34)-methyltransferase